jgi:aspartyl-tRNA(Asn)/glutamyl-tRNA(Gln) amidotransferase subunit C
MLAFAMPSQFSRAQVEAIAVLAQLDLSASEVDLFARQLGDILEYVNQLQQIDTTGIAPTCSVSDGVSGDRADQIVNSLDRAEALANAPDAAVEAGLFRVPRVIG